MSTAEPLAAIVDEAWRLTDAATERELPLRLVGGLAIRLRIDQAMHPALVREYKDIDVVTLKGRARDTGEFLRDMGYTPEEQFNAFNGGTRLLFHDLAHQRQLDVFIGAFRMCHEIPLTDRVTVDPISLPLAELLLTKLQIVNLNEKDLRDTIAILLHHPIAEQDGRAINGRRIAQVCAADWGLWRTCTMNLTRAREGLATYALSDADRSTVAQHLDELCERIEAEPKSRAWRLRSRIGDRKRWYEEPEEVDP
jgi:hypothetical protein